MFRIYLAGPMTGTGLAQSTMWRREVANMLDNRMPNSICCATPGGKYERLINAGHQSVTLQDFDCFKFDRGIMKRDYHDCTTADLVIFNLEGTNMASIGTMMELAWCYQKQIPSVVIMGHGNVHNHPMVREAIDFRVRTLEE